jgi:SDR family mycofactocin-dependent oxidoreductase
MGRVDGKVALITGAGQGQGRSHAVRLAEEGADIVAVDVCREMHPRVGYKWPSEEDLAETAGLVQKAGGRCVTVVADVRERSQLQAAADQGVAEFGYIDVVVANAGVCTFHPESLEIEDEIFQLIVDVNLKGVWNTIQVGAPAIRAARRPGSIILTSSVSGLRGQVGLAHYVGAKHAVVGLTKVFANELAKDRIRVNSVHPTGVSSPGMGSNAPGIAELFATNPLAAGTKNTLPDMDTPYDTPYEPVRFVTPNDISEAVLWLASDESRYVTGAQLPVDAGNATRP